MEPNADSDTGPIGPIGPIAAIFEPTEPGDSGFPLALPLRGRKVLVVGGGTAAASMVAALRAAGALVRVVAPTLNQPLAELAAQGLIEIANRQYQARDLTDAWLAFACSDHRSVNAALAFDAEQARIWCVAGQDLASPAARTATLASPTPSVTQPTPVTADSGSWAARTLVVGGTRSGKSATAEAMLADCDAVDYIATGYRFGTGDAEWDERVRRHRKQRPAHWRTVETLDLDQVLAEPMPAPPALIDCLATWLAQVMDWCGIWTGRDGADAQLAGRIDALVEAWRRTERRVVTVSNEVGSGIEPATESERRFRDELGWLNARLASSADQVWLCTACIAQRLR
jgi:adenosylcobinamide kinase / adenosylcobinamide-phosphate guanylyltransferase